MLDTKGYKHTLRMCNSYCFSPASMIARTRLYEMLYVHCLFCLLLWHNSPIPVSADSFFRFLDRARARARTKTHTGRTLNEWSARNRRRYLHNKHVTNIHARSGTETRDQSRNRRPTSYSGRPQESAKWTNKRNVIQLLSEQIVERPIFGP